LIAQLARLRRQNLAPWRRRLGRINGVCVVTSGRRSECVRSEVTRNLLRHSRTLAKKSTGAM